MITELWKQITYNNGLYHKYEVSSTGNVRKTKSKRPLIPQVSWHGYYYVGLHNNNQKKNVYIHLLVAHAFIGPKLGQKIEVNHKDGNKLNNDIHNLEYCTRKENISHSINILHKWPDNKGIKNGRRKLNEQQVCEIRSEFNTKNQITQAQIALKFGVTTKTIRNIITNKTWKDMK